MTRRELLASGCVAVAASAACSGEALSPEPTFPRLGVQRWRGVNLGGWLVLEKWMTPSLFEGRKGSDEYTFCLEGGADALKRLGKHRDTFITEADFRWIAARGLNAVRLPVGYWVLEGDKPFVSARAHFERALCWASKHGLGVLVDLHAAPGSQNRWDHSGRAGEIGWHRSPENIGRTLDAIEGLAQFCAPHPCVVGIELLNEPRWDVPMPVLRDYYEQGYARVRKHLTAERCAVVIHDGFRPFDWDGFMVGSAYASVALDTHIYQCYTEDDHKLDAAGHARKALGRPDEFAKMQRGRPAIVGEWSVALNPKSLEGLTGFARETAIRTYGQAQLLSYERTGGWFYWSYKLEPKWDWNFRHCVERGLLPERYGDG
jgi:glucan 1,3-beta-glucosidase